MRGIERAGLLSVVALMAAGLAGCDAAPLAPQDPQAFEEQERRRAEAILEPFTRHAEAAEERRKKSADPSPE